ncbi:MAG: serine hydrolase, partial [Pseudomonadota bacterium]
MMPRLALTLLLAATVSASAGDYDYFAANRHLIRNGVQAVLMCNGLFTSRRSLNQVFAQELAYLEDPVGSARGGEYDVDVGRRAVAVGGPSSGPVVRATFREGIGCVVMAPDQSAEDFVDLPELTLPYPDNDPAGTAWPLGDVVTPQALPAFIDADALQAASDWAFNRPTPEQDTVSLLMVHRGQIIHERYAPGFDVTTRTRTWSTAKSIAVTLIGQLVDAGRLELDASLGLDWLPETGDAEEEPRDAITLRHVLQMASGLYPVDSFRMEYATGSGLAYWAGASSNEGARRR